MVSLKFFLTLFSLGLCFPFNGSSFAATNENSVLKILKEEIALVVKTRPNRFLLWNELKEGLADSTEIYFFNMDLTRIPKELFPPGKKLVKATLKFYFDFTNDGIRDHVTLTIKGGSNCKTYEFFKAISSGKFLKIKGPNLEPLASDDTGELCSDTGNKFYASETLLGLATIHDHNFILGWDTFGPYGILYVFDLVSDEKQVYHALIGIDFIKGNVGIFKTDSDFWDEVDTKLE